jgi:hypothetical protein
MKKSDVLRIMFSTFLGVYFGYLITKIPYVQIQPEIEPKFKYLQNLIINNCKKYDFPSQYFVKFAVLPNDEIGVCEKRYLKWGIKIDKNAWNKFDEAQQLALIAHETFHCALELQHNDNKISIMNSFLPTNLTLDQVNSEILTIIKECK